MAYYIKYFLLMPYRVLRMSPQLLQINNFGHPKLPTRVPNFVPFHPIWENNAFKSIEEKHY